MNTTKSEEIRVSVMENYKSIALEQESACGCQPTTGCCDTSQDAAEIMGYSKAELAAAPEGSNLGLGCGNPNAIAELTAGETVLDLGSGGGFDCFLAANAVGASGRVIGVDMTAEMVHLARTNATKTGHDNVEFRLGEIEYLPVPDASVDVIMSNCVVNLSPEKDKVFAEGFRVLKPGGRIAISDVVATAEIPADVKADDRLRSKCVSGAEFMTTLEDLLQKAGFENISITPKEESREFIHTWAPDRSVDDYLVSAIIQARKPLA
jgi:ubiquinone/menaquinone biosynthesis C-methylase UbiE